MTPLSTTLVIPTYDRPGPLAELLATVVGQGFDAVVVVNDAGVPVTDVVARFPDLPIAVIDQPVRGGQAGALNAGVAAAVTPLVMLCDDDDMLSRGHLARMRDALAAGADLAYCDAEVFDYVVVGGVRRPTTREVFAFDDDPAAMRRFSTFIPSGCAFTRALSAQLGPFDTTLGPYWDWDFYLRAVAAHRVVRVPVASVAYASKITVSAARIASDEAQMTADPGAHQAHLAALAAKHGLGDLPSANFRTLLSEPEVMSRRSLTQRVWDGEPAPIR